MLFVFSLTQLQPRKHNEEEEQTSESDFIHHSTRQRSIRVKSIDLPYGRSYDHTDRLKTGQPFAIPANHLEVG